MTIEGDGSNVETNERPRTHPLLLAVIFTVAPLAGVSAPAFYRRMGVPLGALFASCLYGYAMFFVLYYIERAVAKKPEKYRRLRWPAPILALMWSFVASFNVIGQYSISVAFGQSP